MCHFHALLMSSAVYRPPILDEVFHRHVRIVDKPYDETWNDLIKYSAATFFAIENFEKSSGLITLGFGVANPGEFIDGGYWKRSQFEGNYVDFLIQTHWTEFSGRMNIVASPVSNDKTSVTVNARYIFRACPGRKQISCLTWAFDSGGHSTVEVPESAAASSARTLRPSYKAEQSILNSL